MTGGLDRRGSEDDLLIVPTDQHERLALVFGRPEVSEELGDGLDALPVHLVERVAAQLREAGVHANSVDASSSRWVRLSEESWEQVRRSGLSEDRSGALMGQVRNERGQVTHIVRFDRLRGLAVGQFVTALAVRQVIQTIERELARIAAGVEALLRGSKIELEAELATAHDILERLERRFEDRGRLDAADWQSLANLEATVGEAYHQTLRWLDPLRVFLTDDVGLVSQVRHLRESHGIKDVSFWLRMHVHAELTLKRWESLYLIFEAQEAPERAGGEAARIRERAERRHEDLLELLDLLAGFLDHEDELGLVDRIRFVNRQRLLLLRAELARVTNAYAQALHLSSVAVPAHDPVTVEAGPLIEVDGLARTFRQRAAPALETGRRSSLEAATRLRRGLGSAYERARDRVDRSPDEGDLDEGGEEHG